MRAIPASAASFVAEHEGCELESYQDQGGVWTVGYGHTTGVHAGVRITMEKARSLLAQDLTTAASRLASVVTREVIEELTDNQYAALLSFVLNLGVNAKWTIWKRLNARAFDQVPMEMMRFVYIGKTKVRGLVNRRAAEVALWSSGEPGSTFDNPPSSFSRAEDTDPAEAHTGPMVKSKTAWTAGGIVAAGTIQEGARQAQSLIAPQAYHSEWLGRILSLTAIVVVLGGLAILVFKWFEKREAKR